MIKIIHPVARVLALLTIATFWLSIALAELFASHAVVTAVKTAIPWGFLLLIPALAAAGGSGFALAKGRRAGLVGAKLKRMPIIAANGILVLIPSALFLASKARAAEFDAASTPCRRSNSPRVRSTSRYSVLTCATASN